MSKLVSRLFHPLPSGPATIVMTRRIASEDRGEGKQASSCVYHGGTRDFSRCRLFWAFSDETRAPGGLPIRQVSGDWACAGHALASSCEAAQVVVRPLASFGALACRS